MKFVSEAKYIPDLLQNAAIFIIGGTEDDIEPIRLGFTKSTIASIQNYLNQGGKYLGICGGGFIAAKRYQPEASLWANGFNIIPADAVDYSETSKAHLEEIIWKNKRVSMYFQGGPKFIMQSKPYQVIAYYSNGDIAALESHYGKGNVLVIGPHPEADETWLEEANINPEGWRPTQYLAVELLEKFMMD